MKLKNLWWNCDDRRSPFDGMLLTERILRDQETRSRSFTKRKSSILTDLINNIKSDQFKNKILQEELQLTPWHWCSRTSINSVVRWSWSVRRYLTTRGAAEDLIFSFPKDKMRNLKRISRDFRYLSRWGTARMPRDPRNFKKNPKRINNNNKLEQDFFFFFFS